MGYGKLKGIVWHIEKSKGYNTLYRKCFNCYYFDENSCLKMNLPITSNHAIKCKYYINRNDESKIISIKDNNNSWGILKKEEQPECILNNFVEYGDIVKVFDNKLLKEYKIKIEHSNNKTIEFFNKIILRKNIGDIVYCDNINYTIKEIDKNSSNLIEKNDFLLKHHKEYIDNKYGGKPQKINNNLYNTSNNKRKKKDDIPRLEKLKNKELNYINEINIIKEKLKNCKNNEYYYILTEKERNLKISLEKNKKKIYKEYNKNKG